MAEFMLMRHAIVYRCNNLFLDFYLHASVQSVIVNIVDHHSLLLAGEYPSPLNYHFFSKSCCTSVNEVICYGIPDARKLEGGDIVNVDVTVYYKGVHGDLNETFFVC